MLLLVALTWAGTPKKVAVYEHVDPEPPDPIAIATWTNKGFGDEEMEDESNMLEPEDFLWQRLE
eukprot:7293714-Prymnesium_polylepis.1